jgi:predicted hydrocarbon binding protein
MAQGPPGDLERPEPGALAFRGERILALPVEALCEIQRGAEAGGERFATELVAAAGFATGRAIGRASRRGARDAGALLEASCTAATSMGLGAFQPGRLDPAARTIEVEVQGSPFAAAFAPAPGPSCPFLRGVVTGIAEEILGVGVAGEEVLCAAAGADRCLLRARAVVVTEEGSWSW